MAREAVSRTVVAREVVAKAALVVLVVLVALPEVPEAPEVRTQAIPFVRRQPTAPGRGSKANTFR